MADPSNVDTFNKASAHTPSVAAEKAPVTPSVQVARSGPHLDGPTPPGASRNQTVRQEHKAGMQKDGERSDANNGHKRETAPPNDRIKSLAALFQKQNAVKQTAKTADKSKGPDRERGDD